MKTSTQLIATAALLGMCGISHAALTTSSGPVNFTSGPPPSVTASVTSQLSGTANNDGAVVGSVGLPRFDSTLGVLTAASVEVLSARTQTVSGTGYKNNGPGRDAAGSGSSTAAIALPGASFTFSPAITQAGGPCSLAHGPTGYVTCGWGPVTSATATDTTLNADSVQLNDYAGNGTVDAELTLPSLSATTTLSRTQGQTSGSTTTYAVEWTGTVEANYSYLLHAAPSFDGSSAQSSLTLDFGTVTEGSSASPLAFGLFNLANADRVGLDLDSVTGSGDTGTLGTDLGAFFGLAQGGSAGFTASLDTNLVGLFSAQYVLNLSDADVGASSTRGNHQLILNLSGNVAPVPVPAAFWLFGSALAGMGISGRKKSA